MSPHVAIVGGGITGLTAAFYLRRRRPDVTITLIESRPRGGGIIDTEHVGGFVIEAGPDSFLSRKTAAIRLCEALGIAGRLHGQREELRRTFVRWNGQLHPLPAGISGMVPTNLEALETSALLTEAGRRRVAQELTLPPAPPNGDESVGAFISRRFGREAFERLIEPLMGGIYAGNADQLSLAATFPQLREVELRHGSLMRGLREQQAQATPSAYPPFVSLPGGMGELTTALLRQLDGVALQLEATATGLSYDHEKYLLALADGSVLTSDAVLLATPAWVSAGLLESVDRELAAQHAQIDYASTAIVTLAYADEALGRQLAGFGYVVPRAAGDVVLACTWSSSKWAGRAPQGHTLLRVFLGRIGMDVLRNSDADLLAIAREELRHTLDIAAEPELTRVARWQRSMPQYTLGHTERLAVIDRQLEQHPRLALAGAAYRGVGIPDCIASAEQAAERIAGGI